MKNKYKHMNQRLNFLYNQYSLPSLYRTAQGIKTEIINEDIVSGKSEVAEALISEANTGNFYAIAFYILWLWRSDSEKPNTLIREEKKLARKLFNNIIPWVIEKANSGDVDCMFLYGRFCDFGVDEIKINQIEIVNCYIIAAKFGHSAAQNNLGMAYANGSGIEKNDLEAIKWWKLAAEAGNIGAQYNLAIVYKDRKGLLKDEKQYSY